MPSTRELSSASFAFPPWSIGTLLGAVITADALGRLSGSLTGQSGPHETVVAAAIPAILSIGGVLVALIGTRNWNPLRALHAIVFIIVFCASFTAGMNRAIAQRHTDAEVSERQALDDHLLHLLKCLEAEKFVNGARAEFELDRLPVEYFCRKVP